MWIIVLLVVVLSVLLQFTASDVSNSVITDFDVDDTDLFYASNTLIISQNSVITDVNVDVIDLSCVSNTLIFSHSVLLLILMWMI